MATLGKTARDKNRKESLSEKKSYFVLYVWLFLLLVTVAFGGYITVKNYNEYISPTRVYGLWTEVGAPSWSTETFSLSADGVMQENRFIASSFTFDGSVVSFSKGEQHYEYELFGNDNIRLKRISGGGHVASFIKQGYEHTLPKQDNIGPARRVSLAEHFRSRK